MLRSDQPLNNKDPRKPADEYFWADLDRANPFEYDDAFIADIMQQILSKTNAFIFKLKEVQQGRSLENLPTEVARYQSYIAILNHTELISLLDALAQYPAGKYDELIHSALGQCERLVQQLRAELVKLGHPTQ